MSNITIAGIEYTKPQVVLLNHSGLGVAEYGARSAYDSFDNSENPIVKTIRGGVKNISDGASDENILQEDLNILHGIDHSDLLDTLAWTYFHHSVLEHINIQYLIKGTSRAVLQEHARHRMQSLTVRSTRYTTSPVLYAFVASELLALPIDGEHLRKKLFAEEVLKLDLLVTSDPSYNMIEIENIYAKLKYQCDLIGREAIFKLMLAKDNLDYAMDMDTLLRSLKKETDIPMGLPTFAGMYKILLANKQKRNAADSFKHIISDNWKVDMVVSMNLRALKNYLTLRDSNSAFFQIRWLARAIISATPNKYLDLIVKKKKESQV